MNKQTRTSTSGQQKVEKKSPKTFSHTITSDEWEGEIKVPLGVNKTILDLKLAILALGHFDGLSSVDIIICDESNNNNNNNNQILKKTQVSLTNGPQRLVACRASPYVDSRVVITNNNLTLNSYYAYPSHDSKIESYVFPDSNILFHTPDLSSLSPSNTQLIITHSVNKELNRHDNIRDQFFMSNPTARVIETGGLTYRRRVQIYEVLYPFVYPARRTCKQLGKPYPDIDSLQDQHKNVFDSDFQDVSILLEAISISRQLSYQAGDKGDKEPVFIIFTHDSDWKWFDLQDDNIRRVLQYLFVDDDIDRIKIISDL